MKRRHRARNVGLWFQRVIGEFALNNFIWRRGSLRGLTHWLIMWGCLIAAAITFPLVFGWLSFESMPGRIDTYRIVVFGSPTLTFPSQSVVGFAIFPRSDFHSVSLAGPPERQPVDYRRAGSHFQRSRVQGVRRAFEEGPRARGLRHRSQSNEVSGHASPCHEGSFDLRSGAPLAGPPRRSLPKVKLEGRSSRRGWRDRTWSCSFRSLPTSSARCCICC